MSQSSPGRKSQTQDNLVKDTTVGGNFTFAPQQIDTYIETQIVEISVDKITQQPLIKASPYKGLKRFNLGDREYFFGRDALIAKLFNAVNKSSFSLVLGASGSGKSSVVRAGLIPELKKSLESHSFYDFIFTPNQNPFESLYRCLLSEEKDYCFSESDVDFVREGESNTLPQLISNLKKNEERWFLFIDQFEQLFTICTDFEKRNNFLEGIVQVAEKGDDSVRIVLAMRSDFLEQFSFYPNLGAIANKNNIHLVTEMYPDELRQAIEQPAAKNGVVFEKGLVKQIIKEVEGQKGYLPLLQYTLNLLWGKERTTKAADGRFHIEDRTLNKTNYVALEGVRGALQKRVDEIYTDICKKNKDGELVTKQIFLKLVNIAESDSESRVVSRRAYRNEFVGEVVENTLKRFVDDNLLVSNYEYSSEEKFLIGTTIKSIQHATIEIAHEILLSSWDKLRRWLEEEKEAIILKNWLAGETRRWFEVQAKDESKASDELLKGLRLNQIVEFRDKNAFEKLGALTEKENEFIDASVEWRDRLLKEKEEQRKQAEINRIYQIITLQQSAEALFLSNQYLNALIASLRAAIKLKQLGVKEKELQNKVKLTLQKAVYQVKEKNIIKIQDGVDKVVFSPNGQFLAVIEFGGTVRLLDRTGKQLPGFKPFNVGGQVWSTSFSPDSQQLITVSTDEIVKWWNFNGQEVKKQFKAPGSFNQLLIGSDGRMLIFSSDDNNIVRLRDLENGNSLAEFPDAIIYGTVSPNALLIAKSFGGTLSIWNVYFQKTIAQFEVPHFSNSNIPTSINFSPDSKLIATAGYQDDTICLWDLNGNQLAKFKANQSGVVDVSFSPDGKQLATVGIDSTIRIWGNLQGKQFTEIKKYQNKDKNFTNISVSSDAQLLAVSDDKGIVHLWNLSKSQQSEFPQQFNDISELHFSPDNHSLAVSESNGTIHWLDLKNQQKLTSFTVEEASSDNYGSFVRQNYGYLSQGISFSDDGKWLAIGGNNNIVVRSRDGQEQATFPEGPSPEEGVVVPNWVQATDFDSTGNILATGGIGGNVRLWNWKERKPMSNPIEANTTQTLRIIFSPKRNLIATVGLDGSTTGIRLWNLSGEKLAEFNDRQGVINQIVFSSDEKLLATAGCNGTTRVWDLSGQQLMEFQGLDPVISIAFNPDSQQLVTAGIAHQDDNSPKFWWIERWQIEDLDTLLVRGCEWARDYLENNPDVSENV